MDNQSRSNRTPGGKNKDNEGLTKEERAVGGYGEKAYRVVVASLSEEKTGEQSPGDSPEGAGLVKRGEELFKTGNNRHKGPDVY